MSYILKTFLEALVGVVLGLLLLTSLGGRSMMCGMLGAAVLGQMFALVGWALLIALIVALVSWTVRAQRGPMRNDVVGAGLPVPVLLLNSAELRRIRLPRTRVNKLVPVS